MHGEAPASTPSPQVCERCESPLERGDLRCSICGQATVASSAGDALRVQILRCVGCGAAVAYDPDRRATTCSFCDSVFDEETVEDPVEQSEAYLPFTVSPDEARGALKRWLGSLGWFRPSDLRQTARLQRMRPLWWVGWVFDATAFVSWAGDSNANSRRSSWAPHAGQTEMVFDDILVSASRGLTDKEIDEIAHSYDLDTAQEHAEGPEGAVAEQFDVQRSQARRRILAVAERVATQRVIDHHIPGTRHRKVKTSILLRSLFTRRRSFPAYVMVYRYRERLFRAIVSGQDAKRVYGIAPISIAKVLLAVFGGLALIAFLVAVFAAAVM